MRRVILFCCIVGLVGFILWGGKSLFQHKDPWQSLGTQEFVSDEVRYVAELYHYVETSDYYVHLQLMSYQNPDALQIDFEKNVLLEDSDHHPFIPSKVVILSTSTYAVSAQLFFSGLPTAPSYHLGVYGVVDVMLSWQVLPIPLDQGTK